MASQYVEDMFRVAELGRMLRNLGDDDLQQATKRAVVFVANDVPPEDIARYDLVAAKNELMRRIMMASTEV